MNMNLAHLKRLTLLVMIVCLGCEEKVISRTGWAKLGGLEASSSRDSRSSRDKGGDNVETSYRSSAKNEVWAIAVEGFDGQAHQLMAQQRCGQVVGETGLSGWWVG